MAGSWDLIKGLGRLARFRPMDQEQNLSMGALIASNAMRYPNAVMMVTEHRELSWKQFNQRANQFAYYFRSQGIVAGDTVALLMENAPDMLAALVGVCKLGAVAGLINVNLRRDALKHCIDTVKSKKILFGSAGVDAIDEIRNSRQRDELLYVTTAVAAAKTPLPVWASCIENALNRQSIDDLSTTDAIAFIAPAYYIFTSGTTGLPKAAVITHYHWCRAATAFSTLLLGLKPSDRMYVCLPLFHTAAMLIGFGASTMAGSSFYLAPKFSASRFWAEVRQSNSNIFLYIGELCRYLLNAPALPADSDNPLTTCVGNGLRPEIWMDFKQRFAIEKVAEYYGSTEGNLAFMNVLNRDHTFGMGLGRYKVVKYCEQRGEVERDKRGFCVPVKTGETGLLMNEISAQNPFRGYTDKAATDRKIMYDVFKTGDSFFNTGDLIRRADVGFSFGIPHFQFVDRIGDTFRWKGENVSTSEVEEVVNSIAGVLLSSVYGVQIPGTDGRAGMVALVIDAAVFSLSDFSEAIAERLPSQAQPLFIRTMTSLETTATHKIKKTQMQKEAYNIAVIDHDIWVKKPRCTDYVILDADFHQRIMDGQSGY